jgi:chromatin remodeling complex protein RSC6
MNMEASIESSTVAPVAPVAPFNPVPSVTLEPVPSVESQFNNLLQDLSIFKTHLSDIQGKIKVLEKTVKTELKNKCRQEKIKPLLKVQLPSGFDKPVPVSDELCIFMNKPVKSLAARTEVTRFITNYICVNKLQDMRDRKVIKPNEALQKLLYVREGEVVTYFNLQSHLQKHFV